MDRTHNYKETLYSLAHDDYICITTLTLTLALFITQQCNLEPFSIKNQRRIIGICGLRIIHYKSIYFALDFRFSVQQGDRCVLNIKKNHVM